MVVYFCSCLYQTAKTITTGPKQESLNCNSQYVQFSPVEGLALNKQIDAGLYLAAHLCLSVFPLSHKVFAVHINLSAAFFLVNSLPYLTTLQPII